ncbi:MAG: copper amine oxidase N-terminal domain-containing protein, partial [Calditerricola sp.]|nr:copper amine oxidase N-terminal domain-containing protein [Calditerricola sp.]
MHKRWGRILIIVVAMLAVCGGLASAHLPVQVLVDGKELETKRPPQIVEGTVLVPVRTLAEALGA